MRMRSLVVLLTTAGVAAAAQSYIATDLQPPGSTAGFANIIGLNNKGQVLGDTCDIIGGFLDCYVHRYPGVWSNGVITPLPIPSGYSYIAQLAYYAINDSGTVVGTLANGNTSHVVVWTNGNPAVLPDPPAPCAGGTATSGSSSFGINRAGHILGSTTYTGAGLTQPCGGYWVYNGATFRFLPIPIPAQCAQLPPGYYPGVAVGFGGSINDADQVLQTLGNVFCGPPFLPPPGFPASQPFVAQTNGSYSFLPLGNLAAAGGSSINNVGDVLGSYGTNGSSSNNNVVWDKNGVHPLEGYNHASLNNLGQVVFIGPQSIGGSCSESGCIGMWQNGVTSPVQLPQGLIGPDEFPYTSLLNDAGQFTLTNGFNQYLLTPSFASCGQDVTSQVQVTRGGFRYNHTTALFAQTITVTNTSGSSIAGPISIALDDVPSNATLYGIAGATLCDAPQGSPYLNIAAGPLAAGGSAAGTLEYIDTAMTGITYTVRVLAGPGGR